MSSSKQQQIKYTILCTGGEHQVFKWKESSIILTVHNLRTRILIVSSIECFLLKSSLSCSVLVSILQGWNSRRSWTVIGLLSLWSRAFFLSFHFRSSNFSERVTLNIFCIHWHQWDRWMIRTFLLLCSVHLWFLRLSGWLLSAVEHIYLPSSWNEAHLWLRMIDKRHGPKWLCTWTHTTTDLGLVMALQKPQEKQSKFSFFKNQTSGMWIQIDAYNNVNNISEWNVW